MALKLGYRLALCLLVCVQASLGDIGLRFLHSPEPIVAPIGDIVTFECSLNVPPEQVRWRHDGRFLNSSISDEKNPGKHNLEVNVSSVRQVGDYQCVAWYGASAFTSVAGRLTLAEMTAFPPNAISVIKAHVGNTITINCPAPPSSPPALIQYYKDDKPVPDASLTIKSTGSLVLPNVSAQDEGHYSCTAMNDITLQTLKSPYRISLYLSDTREPSPPHFLNSNLSNYTVQQGNNVTLECTASGYPNPRAIWRKVNASLPSRAEMIPGGLKIVNVTSADRGVYTCEMSNGVGGPIVRSASLYVQEPPVLLSEPAKMTIEEGDTCEMECYFKGEPQPTVTWYLNGEPVENDSLITTKGSRLRVYPLQKRHAGIYQCMATNELGCVYGSTMLQVKPTQVIINGAIDDIVLDDASTTRASTLPKSPKSRRGPYSPRRSKGRRKGGGKRRKGNIMIPPKAPNVTRLSDESVMVRWSVPKNEGLPIQFFKVQYRELGSGSGTEQKGSPMRGNRWETCNEDIAPHIRSYEVTNLKVEHTYRFRIAAAYSNNDNKLSPHSARFFLNRGSPTLKTPLNAPILTQMHAVSPFAIQINWQYTPSPQAPIEGFYVYYRSTSSAGDYIKATVEGEQTRQFVITHLLPDTSYDIKLQSFTVGAASDFSSIRTQKTQREATPAPPPHVVETEPTDAAAGSSRGPLYVIIGATLGGIAALFGMAFLAFVLRRHRHQQTGPRMTPRVDHEEVVEPDKQREPIAYGFTMNGKSSRPNHSEVTNGHNHHSNTITITGNPLDAADHDKKRTSMEMTFLSSHTNNNSCPMAQRTAAGGTSGSVLPGSVLPSSVLPGSVLPGSVLPGSVLPGSVLPGSVLPVRNGGIADEDIEVTPGRTGAHVLPYRSGENYV